jgi:hypothetical protein
VIALYSDDNEEPIVCIDLILSSGCQCCVFQMTWPPFALCSSKSRSH